MSSRWSPDKDSMWEKVEGECLSWPNKKRFKEVFRHVVTGYLIIRWFNEAGVLISSNESNYQTT